MVFILEHWHWWALTLAFVVCAAVLRGSIWMAMTISTAIVGALSWNDPSLNNMFQLGIFLTITFILILLINFLMGGKTKSIITEEKKEPQNHPRGELFMNQIFKLESPIVNGAGTLTIEGNVWKLRGEDALIGEEIRIITVDGIERDLLVVEKATQEY
ncbi:MAG: NfeD family protein [Gammaproteobacteria bacterium]|nr:NfeD family protein [Gammaproteobacteria bacterium]